MWSIVFCPLRGGSPVLSASLERACFLVNYWYSELMVASCISQSAKDSCGFECHFVAFSL